MVMVMKMLLCGISRSVNWGINRVCPNRNNQACALLEEKESQYQMHHKQDDCDTWRWPWWEQGPCPVTYPEKYYFPQLPQATSQLWWTTDILLPLSEEPVFHCPPVIQALKSYSHLQKKLWCRWCNFSALDHHHWGSGGTGSPAGHRSVTHYPWPRAQGQECWTEKWAKLEIC